MQEQMIAIVVQGFVKYMFAVDASVGRIRQAPRGEKLMTVAVSRPGRGMPV